MKQLDLQTDARPMGWVSFEKGACLVGWNAAGLAFSFRGTGFEVTFSCKAVSSPVPDECVMEIDGERYGKPHVLTEQISRVKVGGLADKPHTVRIYKIAMLAVGYFTIDTIAVQGKLLPPPEDRAYRILALGDSLSVGRVVYGKEGDTFNTPGINDCSVAPPFRVAKALNAELQLAAASGWGITHGADGSTRTVVPKIFDYAVPALKIPMDHSTYRPDLILFNLGSNDYVKRTPIDEFELGATQFIQHLRRCYGNVPLVIWYGVVNAPYREAFERIILLQQSLGDSSVYYLPMEQQRADHVMFGHPDAEMDSIYAQALLDFIKENNIL